MKIDDFVRMHLFQFDGLSLNLISMLLASGCFPFYSRLTRILDVGWLIEVT
jgi:hypothetical protein